MSGLHLDPKEVGILIRDLRHAKEEIDVLARKIEYLQEQETLARKLEFELGYFRILCDRHKEEISNLNQRIISLVRIIEDINLCQ